MRLLGRYRPVLYPSAAVLIVAACATSAVEPVSNTSPVSPPPSSSPQQVTVLPPPPDQVADVVDARTVLLSNGLEARILGLAPADECWSAAALKFTRETLLDRQVRYSRASASVITLRLADNDDFATLAVSKGMARAEKDDPVLTEVEKSAAKAGLGLWGPPCKGSATSAPPPPPPVQTTTPPPAPPVETKDCAVSYRVAKEWAGGFHVEIIVRNTAQAAVSQWVLQWKFPGGQKIGQTWNASVHQRGTDVAAMSATGPAPLAPGATVAFRFNAEGPTATPGAFTLNGKTCSL
ncbi:cellulose-binding domain-containing protein [Lentzea alba]|uniref:cellulose binding domain-containing protein n=1 Tax=Lentzea alba TaxID=2714351 RepID=UPI0039BFBB47